jgi:hypothetical protein
LAGLVHSHQLFNQPVAHINHSTGNKTVSVSSASRFGQALLLSVSQDPNRGAAPVNQSSADSALSERACKHGEREQKARECFRNVSGFNDSSARSIYKANGPLLEHTEPPTGIK